MAQGGNTNFREEFLTCSICLEEYSQPRQLPCLHVFCNDCLTDLLEQSHPDQFRGKKRLTCPMCKQEHSMPRDGVSGFPHDFRIQSMLEHNSGTSPAPRRRNLLDEKKELKRKFGELCGKHNCKMELFCEEVKCREPVCSTCYIESHLGHKATLISNKIQDAKAYLQAELEHSQALLEKLNDYSEKVKRTVDQIDATYENAFQRINSKEKQLCEKVKEVCGSLLSEAGKEYSNEIKRFTKESTTTAAQLEKLLQAQVQCKQLLEGSNEEELVSNSNDVLNVFYSARDIVDNPATSWRAPELLNLKEDITDEVIGDIMAPLVGSLCTIDKALVVAAENVTESEDSDKPEVSATTAVSSTAGGGDDASESESSSENDFVKVKAGEASDSPNHEAAAKKDPRAVKAMMVAKWTTKSSITGLGVTGDGSVVLCHYFDHSLSVCDPIDGNVRWRSRDRQLPGLIKALGVMMGTGQPCDSLAVTIDGDDYLAVSYPHQSAIKMFRAVSEWPGEQGWQLQQVGFHNKQVKPAEMAASDKEIMFLHWIMPLARSGEVHVLSMATLPLQHVRTVDTGFAILNDICVLPMLRSDPLLICSMPKGLYAIDMSGNCYWRLGRDEVPGMVTGGVCADTRGHVFVADKENHVVHVLWHDGHILQSLFSGDNGIRYPCDVSYDKNKQNLVITNHNRDEVVIFNIQ